MEDRLEELHNFKEGSRKFQEEIGAGCEEKINDIVQTLRSKRMERGISQQDIADATGMKAPNITRIETHRARPSLEILMRYAAALGYDVNVKLVPHESGEDADNRNK